MPDTVESEEHFLTGAILPVWDRIPGDKPKVYRIPLDDGQTLVGRHVPRKHVDTLLKNFGVAPGPKKAHTPAEVHAQVGAGKATAHLANGWRLKPVRLQNERRIELIGPTLAHLAQLQGEGVVKERINFDTRYFIPIGPEGVRIIERITQARPIVGLEGHKAAAE